VAVGLLKKSAELGLTAVILPVVVAQGGPIRIMLGIPLAGLGAGRLERD
jgi:hypothetical protein